MDLGWFETSLDVKDINASIAFYETLGFQFVEGAVELRTVTLNRGDCRLTPFQGVLHPAEVQLIFWQGDVAAIAAELTRRGIVFEDGYPKTADDGGMSAMLKDPDGHRIYIINMPVHFIGHPAHERPAPPSRPRADNEGDIALGWYELGVPVEDMARSAAFYRKLGFEIVDDKVDGVVTLQNNDCRLSLYKGHLDPARPQLIFWQGDVEAIAHELAGKGVRFARGPASDDKGTGAMLFDPDGHPLYFVNIRGVRRKEARE
jgi:catechol 2,3-dioxygenase-like lactoylglutathione lyase family enzyme